MSNSRKVLHALFFFSVITMLASCHRSRENQSPIAVFSVSQQSLAQPTTFSFASTGSSDSDGTITEFKWDFGDGRSSTVPSPTHVFSASGNYLIRLTVTDDQGALASTTHTVSITTPAVSVTVANSPATITLPQLVSVEVPEASFPSPAQVGIWATSDPVTAEDWSVTSQIFGTTLRASSEIRVNSGKIKPTKTLTVTANIPAELAQRLQEEDEPQVFVQIYQDGGEEVLDSFELVPAVYDATKNTLRFALEPDMLTDSRTLDDSWEAVFVIGSTRTKPSGATAAKSSWISMASLAQPEAIRPWPSIATPINAAPQTTSDIFTLAAGIPATGCGGSTLKPPRYTQLDSIPISRSVLMV